MIVALAAIGVGSVKVNERIVLQPFRSAMITSYWPAGRPLTSSAVLTKANEPDHWYV